MELLDTRFVRVRLILKLDGSLEIDLALQLQTAPSPNKKGFNYIPFLNN